MANNNGIDYKKKYMDLRARFVESLDVAYRNGYEQGYNDKEKESAQQQQQMAMQQMGAMPQMGGSPDQGQEQPAEDQAQQQGAAGGSELDQAIAELEGLVSKAEGPSVEPLKKSMDKLKHIRMHAQLNANIKKAGRANAPFSRSFVANLSHDDKASVVKQEQILSDIMNKWEQEVHDSSAKIAQIANTEALTKKE